MSGSGYDFSQEPPQEGRCESPGYFAVIPAEIRYDKRLRANEKLLYAELTALAQKDGYCWAGNGYFAGLYGVSAATVSRWISHLQACGYIRTELDAARGNRRRVFIQSGRPPVPPAQEVLTKTSRGIDEKRKTPIDEKRKQNNTSKNNTKNREREQEKEVPFRAPVPAEPDGFPGICEEITAYLNGKAHTSFRAGSRQTRRLIRARLAEGFTPEDFRLVIDVKTAEWGRPPGRGERDMRPYLRPETLFGPKFEAYWNQKKEDTDNEPAHGTNSGDPSRFGGTWC